MKALMDLNGAFAVGGLTALLLAAAYLILRWAVAHGRRIAFFREPVPAPAGGVLPRRRGEWPRRRIRR